MDVEQFLNEAGVKFQTHEHPIAYTAQRLAAEEHVSGHAVAKSVVVHADDRCVLCVLPASCKIDLARLAEGLGVGQCSLADETEMAGLFADVEVGSEPPFGTPYGLQTVADHHLAECQEITFSAGSHHKALRMSYADYARLEKPQVLAFCAQP